MGVDHSPLARAVYQAFNSRAYADATGLATEDVEVTLVPLARTTTGRDGFREFMASWATMASDVRVDLDRCHSGEGFVVNEITGSGTHDGPMMTPGGEIPPTGKPFEIKGVEVWELRDGQLARIRNYPDIVTLMGQLGVNA